MLDSRIIKKINDFVYLKPRTVQEIAVLIAKNWRTADRYVDAIAKETGSLAVRTFRSGSRGALKIVYWNNIEKIHSSEFQEKLLKRIEASRKLEFSPFDIYQYADEKQRNAVLVSIKKGKIRDTLKSYLEGTDKQILSFSGNVSWINGIEGGKRITEVIEELGNSNVSIKILSRVTVDSIKNIQKILQINETVGKQVIEVRHREQPLRGFVIDNSLARFREMRDPSDYEKGELDERTLLYYEIFDTEWIGWFQKVFWYFFRTAIPAEKRIKDLMSIRNIYQL